MSTPAGELPLENDGGDEKDRRRLKNFFLKPKYQLKYVNWLISGAFVTLVGTVGFIHYRLNKIDHLLNADADTPLANQIPVYHAFSDITMIALAGFVTFVLFACALVLLINHRVSGPMIAIVAQIDQLRQGNYKYERKLRNKDELLPIYDAVKDLARTLDKQTGEHSET